MAMDTARTSAGTIRAKDNGEGVVCVGPGVPIYSVRVLNNAGSGSWSSVACGIDGITVNAARLGIKVANMGLGGSGSDDGNCGNTNTNALHPAICNSVAAGITYVVAEGNSGADFYGFVPAAYDEVFTVTAMADFNGAPGGGPAATCWAAVDETPAKFSNFTTVGSGEESHTVAAIGVCIASTLEGGSTRPSPEPASHRRMWRAPRHRDWRLGGAGPSTSRIQNPPCPGPTSGPSCWRRRSPRYSRGGVSHAACVPP